MNGGYVGIVVYADDIALLSPTMDGLQNMIKACKGYAKRHNLTFSTHENPSKSKAKCMAFLRETRTIRNLKLNGKVLPWVESLKHLGTTLTSNRGVCTLDSDLLEKRAMYRAKNNYLSQEFYYAYPRTKIWINNVYNTSFYGAPLWDLTSRNFEKLEKTWNVSARKMLGLPRTTHKYLIEQLTGTKHIIKAIWKRYLRFIKSVTIGKKLTLKRVLAATKMDVRSTTGKNLRYLMLKTANLTKEELDAYDEPYKVVPAEEIWRIPMIEELVGIRNGERSIELTTSEIDNLIEYACCT